MKTVLRSAGLMAFVALILLARFAPIHAVSQISVSPASVPTGGTVTITISEVVAGPDAFASLTITDPLGNVWDYAGVPFTVSGSSSMVVTFPDPGQWSLKAGSPGGNTGGTDISGKYDVKGTYVDVSLSQLTGKFVVLSDKGTFSVPEFGQSVGVLAAAVLPVLLLFRYKTGVKQRV